MKIYTVDTDNVLFTGDLHGEFSLINVTINKYNLKDCAIVVCGDIGLGFEKECHYHQIFKHLTKTLEKNNVHLYMFRGNHDDKTYFDGEHFLEYEYIHIISDYSIISSYTRNILCVGGAVSIDRSDRKDEMERNVIKYMKWHKCDRGVAESNARRLYWPDEEICFDENELQAIEDNGIRIDTVCTHTAPSFCAPLSKEGVSYWISKDAGLDELLGAERTTCDNILKWLKDKKHPISEWYYGHFHFRNVEYIEGVKYTLLDMTRGLMDIK